MFVGSARSTNEDIYALNKFLNEIFKSNNVDYFDHIDENRGDDLLEVKDMTPNSTGAKALGLRNTDAGINHENLAEKLKNGEIRALYVVEEDFEDYPEILDNLDKLSLLVVHAHNSNKTIVEKADIVLPSSTYAEVEGTFTNLDGRVQHFTPSLVTKENFRFMGMKMSRLDKFGAKNDRWSTHETRNCKQTWRIFQNIASEMGHDWEFKSSKDVFEEMSQNVPAFAEMDYKKIEEYQGLVLGNGDNPDPKIENYVSYYMSPQEKQKVINYKG